MIKSLKLTNFLSFGPSAEEVPLGKLNVLIGANGSGKSNFLASLDILRNAPGQITDAIREGGSVQDWLWKGNTGRPPSGKAATIDAVFELALLKPTDYWAWSEEIAYDLRHVVSFTALDSSFVMFQERIENESVVDGEERIYAHYTYKWGEEPILNVKGSKRTVGDFKKGQSILAQRRDPDQYPEITALADILPKIALYREWKFGAEMPARFWQKTDLPTGQLLPSGENLPLVLNRLKNDPAVKQRILDGLRMLYEGISDFYVDINGGHVLTYLLEGDFHIPATRLSDGTLRYLYLLAILCDPEPPPLICIEEPELGSHPDVIRFIGDLLCEASERCQIVVTTHSVNLVDAMTETPEAILVCEKKNGGTVVRRPDNLESWVEEYRLGNLWTSGQIGGNRW